ncbi:MAG: hypothetical protein NTY19_22755 [Planctomycetota bacterium]|nr:hypothetical protein [Planctomycetota bacterium]
MNTRESMLRSKELLVQVACAHCRTGGRLWERMWVLMAGAMAIVAVGAAAEKAAVEPAPTASALQPPPRTTLPTPPPEPRARSGEFPPPEPVSDPSPLGRGIQRTMTLLANSTPQHHNHVRVVFYGQSITEQEWSKQVTSALSCWWKAVPDDRGKIATKNTRRHEKVPFIFVVSCVLCGRQMR